jgi:class 3 adenylate cyclase/tetratricopeptide (TPR) repeat protein
MGDALSAGVVTIMFTDVERSTQLSTERGDEVARRTLRVHEEIVRGALSEHAGHEMQRLGDGFMLSFASPRRAVACAVEIQRELARHNRRHPTETLAVRIGLNTGEVLKESPNDVYGEAVSAAARVTAKAQGGEVLITEVVKQLVGTVPGVAFVNRGFFRFKGFPDRFRLYRVTWEAEPDVSGTGARAGQAPLVGREAERARFAEHCLSAVAGEGRAVLIGGEAGIGKTRLVEEVALDAQRLDMLVLTGRCPEDEGPIPYAPFVEVMEAAMRAVPVDDLRSALGDAGPEVARIAPELRRLLPELPDAMGLPADQERRYLFRAFCEFIERLSRRTPLFILLDDLHWADPSTLLLLERLTEQVRSLPIVVTGTYRETELVVGGPLAGLVERLVRRRQVERMTLRRLSREATAKLLAALGGRIAPDTVVEKIAQKSDGNPFFIEEVYRHLSEEGRLLDAEGRWATDIGFDEVDVPASVRLIVGRRLARLSEPTRRVLSHAAAIGRDFDMELIDTLVHSETVIPLDAIDEAERAGLVASSVQGRTVQISFAHELIRETFLAELSLPRRQRLHFDIAEALVRLHGDRASEHAAEISHHLVQAGPVGHDRATTVHYLQLSASRALGASAYEEALRQLEQALALTDDAGSRIRADLLVAHGSAQQGLGRWAEAMTSWRAALDIHEQRGDAEAMGRLSVDMAIELGWAGRFVESVELAGRGLSLVQEEQSAARAVLLAISGNAYGYSGSNEGGDSLTAESVAIAERLGDEWALGFVLNTRAAHHFYWCELDKCVETGMRSVELLRRAGDLFTTSGQLGIVAVALFWAGRIAQATELTREVGELGERLGHHGATMVHLRHRAWTAIMDGDVGALERAAIADLEHCRRHDLSWSPDSLVLLGLARLWQGDWEGGLGRFEQGVKETAMPGAFSGAPPACRLVTLTLLGRHDAAREAADEIAATVPEPGQPVMLGDIASACALVAALPALGRRDQAAALHRFVVDRIDGGVAFCPWDLAELNAVAGVAAAAGENWDEAEEHFRSALRIAQELPHRLAEAETRRFYGAMLVDRRRPGDAGMARWLLSEAGERYQRMNMTRHAQLADDLLKST